MKKINRTLVLMMMMGSMYYSTPAFAQPDDEDPVDVPVNGPGLVALAAAGVTYVVKKFRKKKDSDDAGK